jgi:hypothetical protein
MKLAKTRKKGKRRKNEEKKLSYKRLRLGGLQPLCGVGVLS